MESVLILGKGLLTGLFVAMAPGVIMVVCIQRVLSKSLKSGFFSAFGAAAGNTLSATFAAFFLGIALPFIEENKELLLVFFGLILIILGINIFIKNPKNQMIKNAGKNKKNAWNDFFSVFLIAFANPGFFLAYVAFFAFWGIRGEWIDFLHGIWLLGGVFFGTVIWWILFNFAVNKLRKKFKMQYIIYLNKSSGIVVVALGILAVITSLIKFLEIY